MNKIAKFEKVSFKQFEKTIEKLYGIDVGNIYEKIKLPCRATTGSAGYDFFSPVDVVLEPGQSIKIPTGIRCKMQNDWVLKLYPRSSLGFKYRMQLNNTVGIIDSDYYNSDNEGHIIVKIINDSNEDKTLNIKVGKAFVQGIFIQYGITEDDNVSEKRNGGFGSTGNATKK